MSLKHGKWLAVPLVVLSLASCTGEAAGGDADTVTETSFVEIADQQGSAEGFVGALEDSEIVRCESANGGWVSEGTVTNPEDSVQSYRIYVAFNKNRDTHGLVQVDLDSVAAGSSESWEVAAPVEGVDLSCVLRVERFDPLK